MKDVSASASRYYLAGSGDWQALLTHFELGQGFAFIVLLVPDQDGAEVCRAALARCLEGKGERLVEVPVAVPADLRNIAEPLLNMDADDSAGAVWVARVASREAPEDRVWFEAWRDGVARLNQFRNPLRRSFEIPLVFVGAPWLQEVLRENAPDLWSVRTLVAWVEPHTAGGFTERSQASRPHPVGPDPELAMAEANRLRAKGGMDLAVARMLYRAGLGFSARSQWQNAAQAFSEALDIRRRAGAMPADQADAAFQLGCVLTCAWDYAPASASLKEALSLYRQVGDLLGEANCLLRLGEIALARSDHTEARQRYEEALALYRQVGDLLGEANCILKLGDIALAWPDRAEARLRYVKAQALYRETGDVWGEAACIARLGDIALKQSDHAEARQRYVKARALFRQVGDILGEADCLRGLGDIALERSDSVEARRRFEGSLSMYARLQEPFSIGGTHRRLARLAANPTDRAHHLQAARDAWLSIDRPDLIQELDGEFGPSPISAGQIPLT